MYATSLEDFSYALGFEEFKLRYSQGLEAYNDQDHFNGTTLKDVCDQYFENCAFDQETARRFYKYQFWYINKNPEHMQFFGGALLGVNVLRFTDADIAKFYEEVVDVDLIGLTSDIRKLKTINHTFKVGGDIFNLTLVYCMHRFLTSSKLKDKDRQRAAYDTALIFFYRCAAALLSSYFTYPADPKLAQMAYANLSNKHLIKKLGSWNAVMHYRASDLSGIKGIHRQSFLSFKDDIANVYIITDSQNRIRDLIKNYYAEFDRARLAGERLGVTSSSWTDGEGEDSLKEKTNDVQGIVTYIRSIMPDKHSFIKDELIRVVVNINVNTSFRMVKAVLGWLSDALADPKTSKLVDEFVSKVIVQSMYFIDNQMELRNKNDFPYILKQLKNLYLSTRTTDPDIDDIREKGFKLLKIFDPKTSDSLTLSTRTTIILYISLRAFVGKK